ncbi:energy-coupling factor ABC transporter permease [uncultured Pseudokineococcus sp.]|uniref:energy-coupling factor ABC transporter permease n=1 Tax=uncultured Pseudokineococcus sp. TaxID=1642928 RepID=UPI00262E2B8E|nr:energy-coupling factor ABC transporter permease [uncultured Pseudokineococcus sp.]
MHVPDGFLDLTTSVATAGVSAGAVGVALRRARHDVEESPALPGLVSAFVFAVQMVNFPVGAGTSGHLMGGALAAALVGPATAVVCLTVVLLVQALLFADGGLTALGTNVLLIAVVTVVVGHLVTRGALAVLPRRPSSVVPAAALGGLVSVPAAALVFVGLYALGGAVPVDLGSLAAAMLGWHALIGVGEALITGAVLAAVVAARPDLVRAAAPARRELVLVGADGRRTSVPAAPREPDAPSAGGARRRPLVVALLACLVVAGGVSLLASGSPDGLEHVAGLVGFDGAASDSAVAAGPFADYAAAGVPGALAVTLAGLAGVVVTALLAAGALGLVARRRRRATA